MKRAVAGATLVLVALAAPAAGSGPAQEILFVAAYTTDATGPSKVLAVSPNGTGLRVIAASAAAPRWSPDSKSIVYTSLRAVEHGGFVPTGLAVVPADGGAARQVTSGEDRAQAWSPDGRWIAFLRFEHRKQNLYAIHSNGSGLRLLYVKTPPASSARWAPGSRRLLITTRRGLATVDLAGRVHPVPNTACAEDGAFSPNGKLIAMTRCIGRRYFTGIAVVRVDGRDFRWLARPRGRSGSDDPVWSPDGTRLAYTLSRDVRPSYLEHTEIRMVALSGRRLGNLDSYAEDHDEYAAWSPDGTQIVFDRDTALEPIGEDDRLCVGDATTGGVRELYQGTVRGEQSWRPR